MHDETYETPEGFTLHRPLLLPEVRRFEEVLTFVRFWDHRTMTHTKGVVPNPELVPDPVMIGRNELGPFCSVRVTRNWTSMAVIPTQAVVDAITPRIVTDDDHLSFELILHEDRDRVLVIASHNHIIGSHYLAYIDPASVPTEETE